MKKTKIELDGHTFKNQGEVDEYLFLKQSPNVTDIQTNVEIPLIVNNFLICYVRVEFKYLLNGQRVFHRHKNNWEDDARLKWKILQATNPDHKFILSGGVSDKAPKYIGCHQ